MKHPSTRCSQGKKTLPHSRLKMGHFIKGITYGGWCSESCPLLTIPTELQDNVHESTFSGYAKPYHPSLKTYMPRVLFPQKQIGKRLLFVPILF